MTYLRPILSPTGPPITVPAATANRKANRWIWAFWTDKPNFASDKGVIAADACHVEVFRENQHQQYGNRQNDLIPGQGIDNLRFRFPYLRDAERHTSG